eukprot:4491017-Prymnesium_polylepis.2
MGATRCHTIPHTARALHAPRPSPPPGSSPRRVHTAARNSARTLACTHARSHAHSRARLVLVLSDGVHALARGDVPMLDGAVRVAHQQH